MIIMKETNYERSKAVQKIKLTGKSGSLLLRSPVVISYLTDQTSWEVIGQLTIHWSLIIKSNWKISQGPVLQSYPIKGHPGVCFC